MRQLVINLFSFFNVMLLRLSPGKKNIVGSTVYDAKLKGLAGNNVTLINSKLESSILHFMGTGNSVEINGGYLGRTHITFEGYGNKLVLNPKAQIRDAIITLRGKNCEITVGDNTIIEGIRMVTAGKDNKITIGADCLFSDYIEIWASDTHAIRDENGTFINPEKSITIGNKVWVGSKVTILKGVTIHDGAIIGMASVVTKDVPANVISVGSPSKTVKENVTWSRDYPNVTLFD